MHFELFSPQQIEYHSDFEKTKGKNYHSMVAETVEMRTHKKNNENFSLVSDIKYPLMHNHEMHFLKACYALTRFFGNQPTQREINIT